uniref:Uncharacterized protein n=1 Tax=Pseudoalteromonas translucida (strain TAC 125) TaxID=326442 RepID=A0A6G6AS71_PSET1|nr:hypothetical protein [Pseudoalteromonas translucida]QID24511.1 hypothetical protein PSHA_p00018 [Pseudoalteromonas translucida TAC125]
MTPKKDDITQLCDAINVDLEGEDHAPADKKEAIEKWLVEGNNLELPVWVSKKN